jgi:hypothetical protein
MILKECFTIFSALKMIFLLMRILQLPLPLKFMVLRKLEFIIFFLYLNILTILATTKLYYILPKKFRNLLHKKFWNFKLHNVNSFGKLRIISPIHALFSSSSQLYKFNLVNDVQPQTLVKNMILWVQLLGAYHCVNVII